jgi:imidazolonepropionase-like amidohydrolase
MVQAGLTPIQAITVATLNGAQLLHIEDQYGALAGGAELRAVDWRPGRDKRQTGAEQLFTVRVKVSYCWPKGAG